MLGLVAAVALGYALFRGSVNLDLRAFFRVTGLVLVVVGAGLLAAGIHELQGVGIVPVGVAHLWDAGGILDDGAGVGAVLHGLVGYNAAPSLVEVVAYWSYLLVVGFLFLRPGGKRVGRGRRSTPTPQLPSCARRTPARASARRLSRAGCSPRRAARGPAGCGTSDR